MLAARTEDRNADGHIDGIVIDASAPLRATTTDLLVQGYEVVGARTLPDGEELFLGPHSEPDTGAQPALAGQIIDLHGNARRVSGRTVIDGAPPVLVAATDEGLWYTGEDIRTEWSEPVVSDVGINQSIRLTDPWGGGVGTTGVRADGNSLTLRLAAAASTPASVQYLGGSGVRDLAGNSARTSRNPIAVAQQQPAFAGTVSNPIDPSLTLPFGDTSFWLQPWRSYLDTFPATRLQDAVGINFNIWGDDVAGTTNTARLLGDSGFRRARVEFGWDQMQYAQPNQMVPQAEAKLRNLLLAFKANGIRPLLLLNSNQISPAPYITTSLTTIGPAPAGATQVTLDSGSAAAVIPGKTGFNSFDGGTMAQYLITAVSAGNVATLSQPLAQSLPAGQHNGATLRFAPFFQPENSDGSPNATFQDTMNGWLEYVQGVTQTARSILGNTNFDVEVWNELTFGSAFLCACNYYSPAPVGQGAPQAQIIDRTVQWIRDPNSGVSDIGISDGFESQRPWGSGADLPAGITAFSRHPYKGVMNYPQDYPGVNAPLNAFGSVDLNLAGRPNFIPTFTALFPEYYLTGLQTETLINDVTPNAVTIYGTRHGRFVHAPGAAPPSTWVTEVNLDPSGADLSVPGSPGTPPSQLSTTDQRHFETKAILRYIASFVGKGVGAVYFYAAKGGTLGLVDPGFFNTVSQPGGVYPGDDAGGETINSVRHFMDAFAGAEEITNPRPLSLNTISDYAGGVQFTGDGTVAHPPLYNRDVLAFFPFQVNAHRWVIPTYVMTRDLATLYNPSAPSTDASRTDLPPEVFRLAIGGVNGMSVRASATDPITGQSVPVKIVDRESGSVTVELPTTDYPRLITLEDS